MDPYLIAVCRMLTCAIALPTGVLVKDDYFTLFESVGALEVRDGRCHGAWR